MTAATLRQPTPDQVCAGGGAMGALMRRHDWATTPLGPVESFPQSLRTALSILLDSRFPMYIAWGREFIQCYNDDYRPLLGSTKHPAALGISTRATFAEIWDIVGPMFDGVMAGNAVGVARDGAAELPTVRAAARLAQAVLELERLAGSPIASTTAAGASSPPRSRARRACSR